MKTLYKIIFVASLVYVAISCEYDATSVDNPEFKKQLVVHCFLSPSQSQIVAFVSYNSEIYGKVPDNFFSKPDLSGVKAYLSDGKSETAFYLKNDSFIIDADKFPIIEGHKYFLKVSDDNTGLAVNAECNIPIQKNFEIQVDTFFRVIHYATEYYNFSNSEIMFKTRLNTSNIPNCYIVINSFCNQYERDNATSPVQYVNVYPLKTDKLFIKPEMHEVNYQAQMGGYYMNYVDSVIYHLQICQYNNEYYTYKKSLDNYSDEDSYFTEISPVYTNINGGLGFFCGYTMQEFRMKLNKDMVENK